MTSPLLHCAGTADGSDRGKVARIEQDLSSLRFEMNERFISVGEQLRTMELRIEHFETRVSDRLTAIERCLVA